MAHLRAHSQSRKTVPTLARTPIDYLPPYRSIARMAKDLGRCIYFVRTHDSLVKIGCTTDLARRRSQLAVEWTDLLALRPGTRVDEAGLHRKFRPHLQRGREWYRPAPEIIDYINDLRLAMGLTRIEPWEKPRTSAS